MVDWLNFSQTSGSGNTVITVTASSNTELIQRLSTLTVSSATISRTVNISQPGRALNNISLSPITLEFTDVGGTGVLAVNSNSNWTISGPSWLTLSQASGSGNGTVSVMVGSYTGTTDRIGVVTASTQDTSATATVIQSKYEYISATPETLTFSYTGETKSLYVKASGAWTCSSYPSWLQLSTTAGSGDTTLRLTAGTNDNHYENVGTLYFETPMGRTWSTPVNQEAYPLIVVPDSLEFGAEGGEQTLTVYARTGRWYPTTTSSSITFWVSEGTVHVSATPRTEITDLETTIDIVAEGITKTVPIRQLGNYHLSVDYYFPEAGEQTICLDNVQNIRYYTDSGSEGYNNPSVVEMYVDNELQPYTGTFNFTSPGKHNVKFVYSEPIIPASMLYISDTAHMLTVTSITIGHMVTRVAPRAFQGCDSLTSVKIPTNDLWACSFSHCASLTSVTCTNGCVMDGAVFEADVSLKRVDCDPALFGNIGNQAFDNCINLEYIPLTTASTACTRIGNAAFQNCSALTELTIPNVYGFSLGNYIIDNSGVRTIWCYPYYAPSLKLYTFNAAPTYGRIHIPSSHINYDTSSTAWQQLLRHRHWSLVEDL